MPRHRRLAVALILAGVAVASLPSGAVAEPCAGPGTATTLCLLNAERAAEVLRPLRLDGRLARAALGHSRDMVARGYFEHVSPSGERLAQRVARTGWLLPRPHWILGETLAWGRGALADPAAVVAAWMRSPSHRHVVLRRGYRRVGIAIVAGTPFGPAGDGATYTADFGAGRLAVRRGRAPRRVRRGGRRAARAARRA